MVETLTKMDPKGRSLNYTGWNTEARPDGLTFNQSEVVNIMTMHIRERRRWQH